MRRPARSRFPPSCTTDHLSASPQEKPHERHRRHTAETTADAETLITAARSAAGTAGVPVSVSVLDAGGHLLAFRRDDRAVLISGETSTRKAYTALQLNAPTAALEQLSR
ncbi:heme-binding protein [Nonomuraea sp. NPDC051191]|uniref:heme-binding protein n=1 Tax=Nonomuraea sp. NPDC051191 TaxID=3364372 RepID=UPI0037A80A8E